MTLHQFCLLAGGFFAVFIPVGCEVPDDDGDPDEELVAAVAIGTGYVTDGQGGAAQGSGSSSLGGAAPTSSTVSTSSSSSSSSSSIATSSSTGL